MNITSSNPLVSVIMPAYNHADYIQSAIGSIMAQTYKNIEFIVIDDGSKDLTCEKIQEMESECKKRFSRFVFETQENAGTCKTLNKLVSQARGKYVYLIASDDLSVAKAIETEVSFLEANAEYGLVVGDNALIDCDANRIYYDANFEFTTEDKRALYKTFGQFLQRARNDIIFNSEEFGSYPSLLRGNYIPNGYLLRKDIFNDKDLWTPQAPLEDWWLMLQISKRYKMKYINEALFYYRKHNSNTVSQHEKMYEYEMKTFQYEIKNVLEGNDDNVKKLPYMRYHKKIKINLGFVAVYNSYSGLFKERHIALFGKDILLKKIKDGMFAKSSLI